MANHPSRASGAWRALAGVIADAVAPVASVGLRLDRARISHPLGSRRAALRLGWSGTGREPDAALPGGVRVSSWSRPPDTVQAIATPTERAVILTAWHMGAPDLMRDQFRARPGIDPTDDRHGLTALFGGGLAEYRNAFGPLVREVAADDEAPAMVHAAARDGVVTYAFRPAVAWLACGECRTDDGTLDADGTRGMAAPGWTRPAPLGLPDPATDGHRHVWTWASGRLIGLAEWRRRHGKERAP